MKLDNANAPAGASERGRTRRKRTTFQGPEQVSEDMSLYDYLAACRPPMAEKLLDIALSAYNAPRQLRDEIAQEIRIAWVARKPDYIRFEPAQIAAYAYRIAYHVTLKSWREMGSPVRLPGSAFRKRADGTTYVTPGLLAAPLEWSDLDGWFKTDELPHFCQGALGPDEQAWGSLDPGVDLPMDGDRAAGDGVSEEESVARRRQDFLDAHKAQCGLTSEEYTALSMLIAGKDCDYVQDALGLKRGELHRVLEKAAEKLPEMP